MLKKNKVKKKSKRTLNNIGIKNYGFDYQLEKNIYCYLCCIRAGKKAIRTLDENVKFNTYNEWKEYICDKYKQFSSEKLEEFSRYLNQRIRNLNPDRECENLMSPILLTLLVTETTKYLVDWKIPVPKDMPVIALIICWIILIVLLLVLLIPIPFLLWRILLPIWENHTTQNFLTDYKEIVDSMISEKNEKKNTNHQ